MALPDAEDLNHMLGPGPYTAMEPRTANAAAGSIAVGNVARSRGWRGPQLIAKPLARPTDVCRGEYRDAAVLSPDGAGRPLTSLRAWRKMSQS